MATSPSSTTSSRGPNNGIPQIQTPRFQRIPRRGNPNKSLAESRHPYCRRVGIPRPLVLRRVCKKLGSSNRRQTHPSHCRSTRCIHKNTPPKHSPAPVVPSLRGTGKKKNVGYTIGNRTVYRNIALDLVPGRTEKAREISAPQDWYRTYIEGGSLRDTLAAAVGAAAQNPRVKGFKSSKTYGPFGRLVNQ